MNEYKIRFIGEEKLFETLKALIEATKNTALVEAKQQMSAKQRRSMYRWFTLLAVELNDAGWDMKKVLKQEVDIPWSKNMVHDHIWIPLQKIMHQKSSTTELTSDEVDIIYKTIVRHLGQKTGITVPAFPSLKNVN